MLFVSITLGTALAAACVLLVFIKRDVRSLAGRLREISQSDTNAQLVVASSDRDITALAENVNVMLEHSRRALAERNRAENELKRAITNISHDLRTPLTSARGYLQMLESADLDAETRTRYLQIVSERLGSLSSLMNSLFELARVIEGDFKPDIQRVNIAGILRDVLSASYTELKAKRFAVEADIPDAPTLRLCDEDALRRVLGNLLKNVCVHGRDYLRVRLSDGVIEIANKADSVADVDTASIFERFYTADASRTGASTGLGLAIVKELVTRMGGHIAADVEGDLLIVRVVLAK